MHTKRSTRKSLTDQAAELVEQVTPHVEAARERLVNDYLPVAQTMLADATRDRPRRGARMHATQPRRRPPTPRSPPARRARRRRRRPGRRPAGWLPPRPPPPPSPRRWPTRWPQKVEPHRGRKKRALLLLGLVGLGGFVVKKLRRLEHPDLHSARTRPVPSPRPAPRRRPADQGEHAAGSPAGPSADPDAPDCDRRSGWRVPRRGGVGRAEEPHEVTTPDAAGVEPRTSPASTTPSRA